MAYLLYSEGFRLGGKNSERAASTGLLPPEYDPDTLQNYELGVKTQWRDNSLQLNASLFLMQWNDIQINDQGDRWWVRGIFNGGKAEQKGIEVNGNWNLTRNLALEASVFLADPEFTEETIFTDGDVLPAGSPMPISPDRKYFAAIEYTVPRFMSWPGNTWLRGSWSWHSETWKNLTAIIDNDRDLLIEPWSVSNLQFGFTHDNQWDISLNIRNVFDQHNVDWMGSTDYGALFGDPRFRYPRTQQRPRTVTVAFSKKW
jgi:iron complex outermembrane recepter protein